MLQWTRIINALMWSNFILFFKSDWMNDLSTYIKIDCLIESYTYDRFDFFFKDRQIMLVVIGDR